MKRYPNAYCFTRVVRQAGFIVLMETPVRGLLFARSGSGAIHANYVCSVTCWPHFLCMFVTNYYGTWLPFMCLVYCSSIARIRLMSRLYIRSFYMRHSFVYINGFGSSKQVPGPYSRKVPLSPPRVLIVVYRRAPRPHPHRRQRWFGLYLNPS